MANRRGVRVRDCSMHHRGPINPLPPRLLNRRPMLIAILEAANLPGHGDVEGVAFFHLAVDVWRAGRGPFLDRRPAQRVGLEAAARLPLRESAG